MKFVAHIVITFLLAWLVQFFLPWWTLAIIAFVVGYLFAQSGLKSFLAGFLAIGLLWLATALYIDIQTNAILSQKVGSIFPSVGGSRISPRTNIFILTVIIGGLVGGMASLTGSTLSYKPRRRW